MAPTIISDFYPVKVRGQVFAWFYMAIPVGSALGYGLGGLVADSNIGTWGANLIGVEHESWRWAFFVVVAPGILLALWSVFMREPPRGQADSAAAESPRAVRWRDYGILLRTPSYVLCTLGMAAMTFAIGGMAFWMPYYLQKRGASLKAATVGFGALLAVAGLTARSPAAWPVTGCAGAGRVRISLCPGPPCSPAFRCSSSRCTRRFRGCGC